MSVEYMQRRLKAFVQVGCSLSFKGRDSFGASSCRKRSFGRGSILQQYLIEKRCLLIVVPGHAQSSHCTAQAVWIFKVCKCEYVIFRRHPIKKYEYIPGYKQKRSKTGEWWNIGETYDWLSVEVDGWFIGLAWLLACWKMPDENPSKLLPYFSEQVWCSSENDVFMKIQSTRRLFGILLHHQV